MTTESERLARAAAAGKRAGASPLEKEVRITGVTKMWVLGTYLFEIAIAVWLGRHGAPWVMVWGWWAIIAFSAFLLLTFGPLARKVKRRSMLLAREQVHRVRKLDANDPVGLGLGHLFDADPGLDRMSVEAGVSFTLAAVNAVLDQTERDIPQPSWLGYTVDNSGKATKK